jgi:hypothetical protein
MTRVTVNLSKQREAAVVASGKTLIELIDIGLEYTERAAEAARLMPDLFAPDRRAPLTKDNCKHPKARRSKGGLCMACGTNVGDA